jgi:hypothetical protein
MAVLHTANQPFKPRCNTGFGVRYVCSHFRVRAIIKSSGGTLDAVGLPLRYSSHRATPQGRQRVLRYEMAFEDLHVALSQLDDFFLETLGDLTILALQLAQFQEFACGFGRVVEYVATNSFDFLLNIPKLLGKEDSQRLFSVCAHILYTSMLLNQSFRYLTKHAVVNLMREIPLIH